MKKIAIVASVVTLALGFTAFVAPKTTGDSNFEGTVTYTMTVDNQQYAQYFAGSTVTVSIKGSKSKWSTNSMMYKRIEISDANSSDNPVKLVEAGGNKYQVKDTAKTEKDPVIKYVDGSKVVAGYTCKKAQVTSTDKTGQSITTDVYYTDKIVTSESKKGKFKGLNGFPLEFSVSQQGMSITISATEVKTESVSDNTFTIPKGYKLMTEAEIRADMMKNMGGGN